MTIYFENITRTYQHLSPDSFSPCDIYAGERSQELAQELGIPQAMWMTDRAAMQIGQENMARELSRELPRTQQDWDARLEDMVSLQVRGLLRSESSDMARKGMMVQILRNNMLLEAQETGKEADGKALEGLNSLSLPELQNEVVRLGVYWTKNRVLPLLRQQCQQLAPEQDPEQLKSLLRNPAALAVASYMEMAPNAGEHRNVAETLGAAAEGAAYCLNSSDSKDADIISYVAICLLVLAVMTATVALIMLGSGWLAAAAAHLLVEQTVVGIGASIAAEMTFIGEIGTAMLKLAGIGAILSGAFALIGSIFGLNEAVASEGNGTQSDTEKAKEAENGESTAEKAKETDEEEADEEEDEENDEEEED